MSVGSHRK